jgi:hypothetical protein
MRQDDLNLKLYLVASLGGLLQAPRWLRLDGVATMRRPLLRVTLSVRKKGGM